MIRTAVYTLCYSVLAASLLWPQDTDLHTQNWATHVTCWWNANNYIKIIILHIGRIYLTCHMQKWAGQVAVVAVEPHGGHYWQTAVPGVQAVAASPRVKSPAALLGSAFATGPPLQASVDRHPLTESSPKSKKTVTSQLHQLCTFSMLASSQLWTLRTQTHQVIEICTLLCYYAASSGNFLLTFWDNILVPSSRVKNPKRKMAVGWVYIGKREGSGKFSVAWYQSIWLVGVVGRE
jgi:hypothetical protein